MDEGLELLVHKYLDAKEFVVQQGYGWELDWQSERSFDDLTESEFLRETAWVVLSSGFREAIVRSLFPGVSCAFLEWRSAGAICSVLDDCRKRALEIFRHLAKINAICDIIGKVADEKFKNVKKRTWEYRLDYVQNFPFIGPVTGLHLLKNIGISVAKPDRHMVRIAEAAGFDSAQDLCMTIGEMTGDDVAEVDLVLWRYATLNPRYGFEFHMVSQDHTC